MIAFVVENKEFLALCLSAFGVLMSFTFGGFLSWRHRICIDYKSQRDVAINILQDAFVQRTSNHYSEVADERKRQKTAVEDIYRRPKQMELIQNLATDLEKKNRVRRLFRWLMNSTTIAFYSLWTAIVLTGMGIGLLFLEAALVAWIAWGLIFFLLLFIIAVCVSFMCFLDTRFIHLVNDVIEPEGE